ncbi:glutamate ligase domain-containing protein, partial [Belliella pelovolcani]
ELGLQPRIICDTGHNQDGISQILNQLNEYTYNKLWMILGMVNDKDLDKVLAMLPKEAAYIFVEAKIPRALSATALANQAEKYQLKGLVIADVNDGLAYAKKNAAKDDLIFIGGSTFVVAEINDL